MHLEVKDVKQFFEQGWSANSIAKLTTITPSGFKKKIKENEWFEYIDNEWLYLGSDIELGEHVAPLTTEGMQTVSDWNWNTDTKKEKVTSTNKSEQLRVNKNKKETIGEQLTSEDIVAIKRIIAGYDERLSTNENKRDDIIASMNAYEIGKAKRERQSFNISKNLDDQITKIGEKQRISKSDLVELALIELVNKYFK